MSSLPAPAPSINPLPFGGGFGFGRWCSTASLHRIPAASIESLDDFREWCERSGTDGFTRETVQRYRAHLEARGLAPSSLNLYLTVLRKLAQEAAANRILSQDIAASIIAVKGTRQKGTRLGTWLTLEQAHALLRAPAGDGLRARRDQALLALLVGCGLRRSELASLELGRIQQREGRWVIVDLQGKRSRVRSVPMPAWAKAAVDRWTAVAAIDAAGCSGPSRRKGKSGKR